MRLHSGPGKAHLRLQSAGLTIPGASQLLTGQPLSDPKDRAALARLLTTGAPIHAAHPPSQPPPPPPTPLPPIGPVLFGTGRPRNRQGDGVADSIWMDLGLPVTAERRRQLHKAGLSRTGVEELLSARAVSAPQDRALLATWFGDETSPPDRAVDKP